MKLFFCAGAVLALLGGCTTGADAPAGLPASSLYGSWRWVSSTGGFAGVRLTPPPEKTITYLEDGTYMAYTGDSLAERTMYWVVRERTPFDSVLADVVYYRDRAPGLGQTFRVRGDTLELTDLCIDCFFHVYVRIRPIRVQVPPVLAGTSWRLGAFAGSGRQTVAVEEADTIVARFTSDHMSGHATGRCGNSYDSRYTMWGGYGISVTELVSSGAACPASMYWEYIAALRSVKAYMMEDSALVLTYGVAGESALVMERQ